MCTNFFINLHLHCFLTKKPHVYLNGLMTLDCLPALIWLLCLWLIVFKHQSSMNNGSIEFAVAQTSLYCLKHRHILLTHRTLWILVLMDYFQSSVFVVIDTSGWSVDRLLSLTMVYSYWNISSGGKWIAQSYTGTHTKTYEITVNILKRRIRAHPWWTSSILSDPSVTTGVTPVAGWVGPQYIEDLRGYLRTCLTSYARIVVLGITGP